MRRAAKIDANQTSIVTALRKAGCTVLSLAAIGHGAPDILVGHKSRNVLMEIKGRTGKLNAQQQLFKATWAGDVRVVRSPDDALLAMGLTE